ncbi:MAG: type II secretion system protein [Longimicrobiales bacterium]
MTAQPRRQSNESGFALIMTVLVVVIVGSLIAGAMLIGSNHILVNNYYDRSSELESVADGGLEWARALLNADTIYPDSGFITIENGVTVTDGGGNTIPGVRRWIYAGPSGVTSGQYGVFGSIVAVVEDAGGGRVIRRSQVYQESFSKYAYFTDIEPSTISFGNRDQIFGPVHSNDDIKIYAPSGGDTATFHGPVRTAQQVPQPNYGRFRQGYQENVAPIPLPATASLTKLQVQAALGSTAIVGNSNGSTGEATTRVHFVAIDLNGDGDRSDDNEGFIRVYQSNNATWVTATGDEEASSQCGDVHAGVFITTNAHPGATGHSKQAALKTATSRCYLGGDDRIGGVFRATTDGFGSWLQYPGATPPVLLATTRPDSAYLFPISRALNPNFKGVIHVTGKVIISGEIRGRVTVAATDDIIFGDDITYVTDPSAGTCVDIAGYFAQDDIIVADNNVNSPRDITTAPTGYRTLDDTSDEFIHGTVLALDIFTVQNYSTGASNYEDCEGADNGRGCLYLTGGIIQRQRGAVGLTSGQGYIKRYAYDACGATSPPPYFPTTGVFARGQYYQVDPAGFDINAYFALITP